MRIQKRFLSPANIIVPIMILSFVWLTPTAYGADYGTRVELSRKRADRTITSLQLTDPDFTMPPSVTTSTIGAGVETLDLLIFCVNLFTGKIIPNCNVQLTHAPEASSGGHNHNSNRPRGTFTPDAGNTGPDGFL